ncbi:MAG: hypothetical protein WB511_09840, partial [Nitrososphaeraceae archaeon]
LYLLLETQRECYTCHLKKELSILTNQVGIELNKYEIIPYIICGLGVVVSIIITAGTAAHVIMVRIISQTAVIFSAIHLPQLIMIYKF